MKSVEFKLEVQQENDQLLHLYLSKADKLRDVLNSRTNAFLLLPRSKTPLR